MNRKLLLIIIGGFLVISLATVFLMTKRRALILESKQAQTGNVNDLVKQAQDKEVKSELVFAKDIYQKLINEYPGSSDVANWQKKLEDINIRLLFSNTVTAGSALYEIKSGDTLVDIAKQFKTTVDLIRKSNNLTDDKIIPGRKLKVWKAPFSILIDKSQNTLILKTAEDVVKTYIVSTGANNSTPTGTFKIVNKLENPTWFKAGTVVPADSPDNILGSRWLGFNLSGYGIHGTTDPQSLGKQATQGCVRLSNPDVEELYIIVPLGTEVTIVD